MTWRGQVNGHQYVLDWPDAVWPVAVFVVLIVAALALAVALGRRHAPAVGVTGAVVTALGLIVVALSGERSYAFVCVSSVFERELREVDRAVSAALCAVIIGAGLAVWAAFPHEAFASLRHRLVVLGASVVLAALGWVGASRSSALVAEVKAHNSLPALRTLKTLEAHIGRTFDAPVVWATQAHEVCHNALFVFRTCGMESVMSGEVPMPECTIEQRQVAHVQRGANEARATGRCTWPSGATLHIDSPVEVNGVDELGSPRFPLRVGDRWEYVRSTWRQGGALFWGLISTPAQRTEDEKVPLTIEVMRAVEADGLRRFEVAVTYPNVAPKVWSLVAADGDVWVLGDGGARTPLLKTTEGRTWFALTNAIVEWQPGGALPGEEEASLEALKHATKKKPAPQVRFSLPGPMGWAQSHGGDLGGALLAVLTVGLVLPPSSGTEWALRRTRVGTGEAAPVGDLQ